MTDKTEQKILDAALKVFSQKGFKGATTKIIAQESGFSELTLFRKFETKENLFNSVLTTNRKYISEELDSVLIDKEFKDSKDFLVNLMGNLTDLIENDFDFINILVHNQREISGNIMMEIITQVSKYIERVFPDIQMDPRIFVLNIFSFLYFIIFDKNLHQFFNCEDAIEEFIDHSSRCL